MKKYQIIYADSPWKYNTSQHTGAGGTSSGGSHTHYQVMEDEEICKLPIAKLADKDCLLFMWVTGPKLNVAFDIGKAWGFSFCTVGFVWYKKRDNPGTYTMSSCEYVLIFKRGIIPQPRGERNTRQFLAEERTKHSAKPKTIRDRIDRMFPESIKIELFGRDNLQDNLFGWDKFEGWDVWGNECKSDIKL